jgi:recombination protein RecA
MAPPFKQAEFDILYGTGISREGSLIDFGVEHDIVKKSGAWYTYEGDQLGQGKENARKYLIEHADLANDIERKILSALGVGKVTAVPPLEGDGSPAQGNSAEDAAAEATPVESLEDKIAERKAAGA